MYKVGDKVIITKYNIAEHATVVFVKGYALNQDFYVVRYQNGSEEHIREDELIKDE
jgi:hypothetical protein